MKITDMNKLAATLEQVLGWRWDQDATSVEGGKFAYRYRLPWGQDDHPRELAIGVDVARQIAALAQAYQKTLDLLVEVTASGCWNEPRCDCDTSRFEQPLCLPCRLNESTFRDAFLDPDCYEPVSEAKIVVPFSSQDQQSEQEEKGESRA